MGKWTLGLACAVTLAGFLAPLALRAQVDPNTVDTTAIDAGAVDTGAGTFGGGVAAAAGGFVGGRGAPAGQVPGNLIAGGFGGGGGGRGGRGGRGGTTVTTAPVSPAVSANAPTVASTLADLIAALNDPNSPDDALKAKLQAYRDAKERVESDLTQAQEELKTYVTLRQEAILINLGYLD